MSECDPYQSAVEALVDGELTGAERQAVLSHIENCASCREDYDEARALSRLLAQQKLQGASPDLHARIEHLLQSQNAPEPSQLRVLPPSSLTSKDRSRRSPLLLAAAVFCLAIIGLSFALLQLRTYFRSHTFLEAAVQNHREVASQIVPLDVQSSSPDVVANWFRPRVTFAFRMPDSGIAADNNALYTLRGGRLVTFGGAPAALIAFQRAEELITILITSQSLAHNAAGSVAYSSGIAFHSLEHRSSHIVTWENQGLLYGLVSPEFEGKGRACSACHQQVLPNSPTGNVVSMNLPLRSSELSVLKRASPR